jgi:hypothetical protein
MLRRAAVLFVAPVAVFAIVRPLVGSDALALAIAGAPPLLYALAVAVVGHRLDPVAAVSALSFAVACVVSALADGSSLPLKVHGAAITCGLGTVLLTAAAIGRPIPLGRLLNLGDPAPASTGRGTAILGALLVVHALVHVALAVELSTSSYLVVSRIVNWASLALAVVALSAYRARRAWG